MQIIIFKSKIFLDYHNSQIDKFLIYENRLIIALSIDGIVSFTDISNLKKLNQEWI